MQIHNHEPRALDDQQKVKPRVCQAQVWIEDFTDEDGRVEKVQRYGSCGLKVRKVNDWTVRCPEHGEMH